MGAAVAVHHTLESVPAVVQSAVKVVAPLTLMQNRPIPFQVMGVTIVVKTDVKAVVKIHVATVVVLKRIISVESCVV